MLTNICTPAGMKSIHQAGVLQRYDLFSTPAHPAHTHTHTHTNTPHTLTPFEIRIKSLIFQPNFTFWWLRYILWNCPQAIINVPHRWQVNTGSGNGLVPSGNKPLLESVLTQIYIVVWCHQACSTAMYSLNISQPFLRRTHSAHPIVRASYGVSLVSSPLWQLPRQPEIRFSTKYHYNSSVL